MGAFKEEKVKKTLITLLNDEEVNGHVIYALSKFKDKNLIQILIPFLEHKVIWKREEAKKAIKKLEKLDKQAFIIFQTFEFKIKRYRKKFDFLKRFKKVFSNRRKNNNLNIRVKNKNYFQNMTK